MKVNVNAPADYDLKRLYNLSFNQSPAAITFLQTKMVYQENNCGQCDQQFLKKRNLIRHRQAVHEGVKFPCRQCDKLFSV